MFTDLSLQIPIAGTKFTDLSLQITPYKEDGKKKKKKQVVSMYSYFFASITLSST